MTTETEGIKAYTVVNRVVDFTMKGSYGYQTKRFGESGGSIITAESTVYEFQVDKLEIVDLPHWGKKFCFIGTDYYGREMSLPVDRVLAMSFKDTEDQGRYRGLTSTLDLFENSIKDLDKASKRHAKDTFEQVYDIFNDLKEKGIEIYVPKRAVESEL